LVVKNLGGEKPWRGGSGQDICLISAKFAIEKTCRLQTMFGCEGFSRGASGKNDKTMSDKNTITPARVWFRFLRLRQRCQTIMTQRLRDLGLSIAQFDLMSTLSEGEGITQRDLAEKLYVTKGNVSGLVDRLVEAGLVLRRGIPGDRRSYALHLTDAGRELVGKGMAVQMAFVEDTLGTLPAQDIAHMDATLITWRDTLRPLEAQLAKGAKSSA
jgi:MarR family transcriptional regulator, organic hydroperoxide resistance regulator